MDRPQQNKLLKAVERLEARLDALESGKSVERVGGHFAENLHLKSSDLGDAIARNIEAHPMRSATFAPSLGSVLASPRGIR